MARIDRDQIFHLLKSRRRRLVLDVLDRSNGRMRFRDLVESVASREYDTTRDRLDSTKRKRTYNALYQTHIPALADVGVVDYNSRSPRGTIRLGERATDVLFYLRIDPTQQMTSVSDRVEKVIDRLVRWL
ncbi:DUF7344 domain-containing protein [Haladaptatus pallidirubidus]|uniref:DUF7344 domain-containing protein n=1 Tax=Haladaptatus pallidirubidus TaxID=1008152 RepID=A0AAV3UBS7_9EURY|nr:hypothetical protein [Haladaptatus pallidirubidus]